MSTNNIIIELIKERLDKGAETYGGELDVNDGREWEIEALEEILDGMVYTASAILKLMDKQYNNKYQNVLRVKDNSEKIRKGMNK